MAIVIFSMGMGANIVKYCCLDCENKITYFSNIECCSIHHQDTLIEVQPECCSGAGDSISEIGIGCNHSNDSFNNTTTSTCLQNNDSHCSISRVSIDLNMPLDKLIIIHPMVWISDLLSILLNVNFLELVKIGDNYQSFKNPPNILPRTYLSLIRVLII